MLKSVLKTNIQITIPCQTLFFLVSTDVIAETIAINVGIKGDDRIEDANGVVFRLKASYSGYAARSLWDWLAQAEKRG